MNSKTKWKIDDNDNGNRWRENRNKSDQIKSGFRIVCHSILKLIKLLNASNHQLSTVGWKMSIPKYRICIMLTEWARHEIPCTVAASSSIDADRFEYIKINRTIVNCNAYFSIKIFVRKFKNAFDNENWKQTQKSHERCTKKRRETREKLLTYVKHVPRLFFVDDILWLVFYTKSCIAIRFSFTFYMRFDCLLS